MPQAMKIPDANAAVDKGWKKARDNSSMGFEKSQEQKGGHPGGAKRQHESPLCFIDGHVPPCGTYKTFFLVMGRHHMKVAVENHSEGP